VAAPRLSGAPADGISDPLCSAALARAAGVSERYGQRLLAEFTADPTRARYPNGDGRRVTSQPTTRTKQVEGR
jgi:hypothetical protein